MTSGSPARTAACRAMVAALLLANAWGCTALQPDPASRRENLLGSIDEQVLAGNYQKALILLDETDPDHSGKAYLERRREIETLAARLEDDTEQEAIRRSELNDLRGAIEILEQVGRRIPPSAKLERLREDLARERDLRLIESEQNLLLSEAEFLFSQLEWYEEQNLLEKPSLLARWKKSRMHGKLADLHPKLVSCGRESLEADREAMAERCLQMAKAIDSNSEVTELLSGIDPDPENPSMVPISDAKKSRPSSASSTSFQDMEKELREEIDRGDLVRAFQLLAKLEQYPDSADRLSGYRQKLEREKKNRVARLHKEGSRLYRSGKIAEARAAWQEVLELDPDNHTAFEKISRADKVLKKIEYLKELQERQDGEESEEESEEAPADDGPGE